MNKISKPPEGENTSQVDEIVKLMTSPFFGILLSISVTIITISFTTGKLLTEYTQQLKDSEAELKELNKVIYDVRQGYSERLTKLETQILILERNLDKLEGRMENKP